MWSGRIYRATGQPSVTSWHGEPAIALPLRRPPWWWVPFFAGLALLVAVLVAVSAVRLITGHSEDGPATVVIALLGGGVVAGLFALGTRGAVARRRSPGRVVVTSRGIAAPRVEADWSAIDSVRAHQEQRMGHLRAVDVVVIDVRGVTCTLVEAADLDVDPRAVVDALRLLHAQPRLRSGLASAEGIALFSGEGSDA